MHGEVKYQNSDARADDVILIRRDGTASRHLTQVVDDYQLKISHVLREDVKSLPFILVGLSVVDRPPEDTLQDAGDRLA